MDDFVFKIEECKGVASELSGLKFEYPDQYGKKVPDITKLENRAVFLKWIEDNLERFELHDSKYNRIGNFQPSPSIALCRRTLNALKEMKSYPMLDQNDKNIYYAYCSTMFVILKGALGWMRCIHHVIN